MRFKMTPIALAAAVALGAALWTTGAVAHGGGGHGGGGGGGGHGGFGGFGGRAGFGGHAFATMGSAATCLRRMSLPGPHSPATPSRTSPASITTTFITGAFTGAFSSPAWVRDSTIGPYDDYGSCRVLTAYGWRWVC